MSKRLFSSLRALHHENPLGLPRKGTPPNLAARMQRGLPEKRPIKDVRKVIAVSSAKGGVGKSTIAANLALSFAQLGHRSGILDADIFGPSIPTLFNLTDAEEPRLSQDNRLLPLSNYGVKTMSMGYLMPPDRDSAIVWRGPMVMKALQQLLHEVDWGGLDILVLDLPPGTSDTQLTITQQIVLDGAVIISTPQELALRDSLKGIAMFRKTSVPVLGMVQNMAVFVCPHCATRTHIFRGGPPSDSPNHITNDNFNTSNSSNSIKGRTTPFPTVQAECQRHGIAFLGDVPLDANVCADADEGCPTVVREPESERAGVFMGIAEQVGRAVGL